MPEHGRAERIAFLRTAIARIETGNGAVGANPPALKPESGPEAVPCPPRAGFFEAGPACAADSGAACGFALALAGLLAGLSRKPVLWVAEDFVLTERGLPWPPGMFGYGINGYNLGQIVLMRAARRIDLFRMMEEALRAQTFALVIGEPAALTGEDLPKLMRRIGVAARLHQSPALLLRPPVQGARAAPFLAPKSMRFEIAAAPSNAQDGKPTHVPVVQAPHWRITQHDEQGRSIETGPRMQTHNAAFWRGLQHRAFSRTTSSQQAFKNLAQDHAALSVDQSAAA